MSYATRQSVQYSLRRKAEVLESRGSELHPTPNYIPEDILSSKSMLDNFSNHIEQESKNCDGIFNEMQNLIFLSSVIQFCLFQLTNQYLGDAARSGEKKPDFLQALEDWIESWDKLKKSNAEKFTLSAQTSHALRHTLRCHASLIEDLLQEGYHFVITKKFQRNSYLSGGRFPVSRRNDVCVVRKYPQTQNLKLEFDDTFKTNNSSSQEANDLLPLLERTVDLHFLQLYTKSRDVPDHIAGYVAFKAVKYCKDCCHNCLESFASAPAHGDSYVNLLSRDGLKHPSNQ